MLTYIVVGIKWHFYLKYNIELVTDEQEMGIIVTLKRCLYAH